MNNSQKLLTVQEAAKVLSCGLTQTYKLLNSGKLHGVKIGKLTRIPQSSITDFVAALPDYKTGV